MWLLWVIQVDIACSVARQLCTSVPVNFAVERYTEPVEGTRTVRTVRNNSVQNLLRDTNEARRVVACCYYQLRQGAVNKKLEKFLGSGDNTNWQMLLPRLHNTAIRCTRLVARMVLVDTSSLRL